MSQLDLLLPALVAGTPTEPAPATTARGGAASPPQPYGCTQGGCIQRLAEEIEAIVESCRSLLVLPTSTGVVRATLVGAAEVGVVAESIDLTTEHSEGEFEECLQEALHGLYLDPTGEDFTQSLTVSLGGRPSVVAGDGVSAEARAAVEDVLNAQGPEEAEDGGGSPQIIMLQPPSMGPAD
jgi:hypothetical protein